MEYSFDIEHAEKYGTGEAIMLKNIIFWITKNKANNKHQYDNKTWTYNSIKAFSELFPFWSINQIHRIIKSLIDQKVIITGNYNKHLYDRTLWYALKDDTILEKSKMEDGKKQNGNCEKPKPIPYNKPYNKPVNKPNKKTPFYYGLYLKNVIEKNNDIKFNPYYKTDKGIEKIDYFFTNIISSYRDKVPSMVDGYKPYKATDIMCHAIYLVGKIPDIEYHKKYKMITKEMFDKFYATAYETFRIQKTYDPPRNWDYKNNTWVEMKEVKK